MESVYTEQDEGIRPLVEHRILVPVAASEDPNFIVGDLTEVWLISTFGGDTWWGWFPSVQQFMVLTVKMRVLHGEEDSGAEADNEWGAFDKEG